MDATERYTSWAGWPSEKPAPRLKLRFPDLPSMPWQEIRREQSDVIRTIEVTNADVRMGEKTRVNDLYWHIPVHFDATILVADISDFDLVHYNIRCGLKYKVFDRSGADVTAAVSLPGPMLFNTGRLLTAHPITKRKGPHRIVISCVEQLSVNNTAIEWGVEIALV